MKWIVSEEKKQLRKDIIRGTVTEDIPADLVYDMHENICHKFPSKNFKINLKNLIAAIEKNKDDALRDEERLRNTLMKKSNEMIQPNYPVWNGSNAQALLVMDIESGLHQTMKPAQLRSIRPEYMVYPLKNFRDHLNKEKYKPAVKAYWLHVREMRKQKKRT